jgi:putative pyruvate formate lyase activating enzyme
MNLLTNCTICPRKCGVNRYKEKGYCGATNKIKLSYYSHHKWEEPVISGTRGSGTIFFSNCNLRCLYCQNKKISLDGYGKEITNKRLGEIILELQGKGAHNINLVTPTHYTPQIKKVLLSVKDKLKIPVVYNTSSYENIGTLMMMRGLVDIYLADLKYFDDSLALKYSGCKDYFDIATMAIDEMYRQVGKYEIDKNNIMKKGLIVRVLILPGHKRDAKEIINYLYKTYGDDIFISIMNQYTPPKECKYPNLLQKVSDSDYEEVVNFALTIGVNNAFIQEGETALESFIPDFDKSIV